MSYSLDVNILLYASDASSPHHDKARLFLSGRVQDPRLLCLSWLTLMSYIRIATHSSIFASPLAPSEAWQNVDNLLRLPRVFIVRERDSFAEDYPRETQTIAVRGNLVPDAHLAVVLLQNGVKQLYTNDSDFRKFAFLEIINPLD